MQQSDLCPNIKMILHINELYLISELRPTKINKNQVRLNEHCRDYVINKTNFQCFQNPSQVTAAPFAANREQTGTHHCFHHSPELSHKIQQLSSCRLLLWLSRPTEHNPSRRSCLLRDVVLRSASASGTKKGGSAPDEQFIYVICLVLKTKLMGNI